MKKALAAATEAVEKPEGYTCNGCGKPIDWWGACNDCVKKFDQTTMNRPDRMHSLGIPRTMVNHTWDNFEMPRGDKYRELITKLKILKDWVGIPPVVFLFGRPGTGKSHLAVATVRRRMDLKGHFDMRFIQERSYLENLKHRINSGEEDWKRELVAKVRFLVIDDLGQSRLTEFAIETMFGLVTRRFDEGRVTLITTNLVPGDIDAIDPRLGSRLHESLVINTSSMTDRRRGE